MRSWILLCAMIVPAVAFSQPRPSHRPAPTPERVVIPAWATNVCFVERFRRQADPRVVDLSDWNQPGYGADFFVYGPSGSRLRFVSFTQGHQSAEIVLNRTRDTSGGSWFTGLTLPHHAQRAAAFDLYFKSGAPASFFEEQSSLSSGQPILQASGSCHVIPRYGHRSTDRVFVIPQNPSPADNAVLAAQLSAGALPPDNTSQSNNR